MSTKPQQPDAEELMMCPICIERLKAPISQCQRGHSMCGECIKSCKIDMCPSCRAPISNTRNYQLEQLIESLIDVLKLKCCYTDKGCKYTLPSNEKEAHELECRYRKYFCEGKKFAGWKCNWSGNYADIHQHFVNAHNRQSHMEYSTEANMKIDLSRDFFDLHIISFFNGQNFFYYKHKIDVTKQKAYWTFQMIGLQDQAEHYMYEFEIHSGPVRKFKVIEVCQNDTVDTEDIFDKEKCVVVNFSTLKNYLNENGDLPFRFRIMSIRKTGGPIPKKPFIKGRKY